VRSAQRPDEVGALAAEAISASYGPPGGSASLILPADCAWSPANATGPKAVRRAKASVPGELIDTAAKTLRAAAKPVLLLGTTVCTEAGLAAAGRLAAHGV